MSNDAIHTEVQATLPLTYHHFNQGADRPLLILVHGYTDTALGLIKRALPDLDSRFEILAPNGLFPVPQKIENGWKTTYSWYFAELTKGHVLVSPKISASAIQQLVMQLNLQKRKKILIGFSQGGFFMPYLFSQLENVQRMIGIGTGFRIEDYKNLTALPPVDAIHGTLDEVIPFERAQESFESLKQVNPTGQFYGIDGLKHTMNDEARTVFKDILSKALL